MTIEDLKKLPSKEGIPIVTFRGTNWASCSNSERLNKWNKNQNADNKKTDLSDIGLI